MSKNPTLTVIMLDKFRTMVAICHEGEHCQFGRRTVQIELTDEQAALIAPRHLGRSNGVDYHEEIGQCWIEPQEPPHER